MRSLLAAMALLGGALHADPLAGAALANPLEDSGGTARATAMGGAFVSVADDSSAMLWNPAGLASLKRTQLGLHHNTWIAGTLQEIAALGYATGGAGNFGLSASYLDFGIFDGYDSGGASTGSYGASRMGLGLGWGREFAPGLGLGLALKGQSQSIAGESLSAFSGDVGLHWAPARAFQFGLAYAGLGAGPQGSSLASSLRMGLSGTLDLGPQSSLLLALGGAWQPGGVSRIQAGLEAKVLSALFLRGGYQLNMPDAKINGMQGMTLGMGFQWSGYALDYAWQPFGDLGSSQRLSLSYDFGAPTRKAAGSPVRSKAEPAWRKEGKKLESAGKFGDAVKLYHRIVQADAKNGEAWKAMGKAYLKSGRKGYAAQSFEQAAKLSPKDPEIKSLLKSTRVK